MAFAVFEFLEEFALCLVVQICVFSVLDVTQPDGRVDDLGLRLHRAAHALIDRELDATVLAGRSTT